MSHSQAQSRLSLQLPWGPSFNSVGAQGLLRSENGPPRCPGAPESSCSLDHRIPKSSELPASGIHSSRVWSCREAVKVLCLFCRVRRIVLPRASPLLESQALRSESGPHTFGGQLSSSVYKRSTKTRKAEGMAGERENCSQSP